MNIIYLTFNLLLGSCWSQIFKPFSLGALPFISKNTNLCNEETQSAIVEDFFNTVFTEFLTAQPACVCIQLCIGQSTFCYPNGCFRHIQFQKNNATSIRTTTNEPYVPGDYDDLPPVHLKFHSTDRTLKVTIATSRPMLLRENPFKDRFQLLSYLAYKRPSLAIDGYSEQEDNVFEEYPRFQKEKIHSNIDIDIKKTRWPTVEGYKKLTDSKEKIQNKPLQIVKDSQQKSHSYSSSFNVEDTIRSIEKQNHEQKSQDILSSHFKPHQLYRLLQESFFSSEDTEAALADKLKVLSVTNGNKTKSTKVSSQHPSITHIIANASKKNEPFNGESSTRKSYISRRKSTFDLRRMKNQINRRNLLGNELRAVHLRMKPMKRGRVLQRGRNLYRRKKKEAADDKEERLKSQVDQRMTIVDIDTTVGTATTSLESATDGWTGSPVDCEQITFMTESYHHTMSD